MADGIKFNEANFDLVLAKIKAEPENWNQRKWHCGTSHCFAGWAQILAGKPANNATVRKDARVFLGLNVDEADYLFYTKRTMADFEAFKALGGGYDSAGYDRCGYDRDGYNRAGYDHAGYDRDGYDRDGYDRTGYDRAGYDRDGYDRNFYDRAGYDHDGLDANNNPRPE